MLLLAVLSDWVTDMLRNALLHESGLLRNPADSEWTVKVHTIAEMLPLSLDYELTGAVAENLNNTKWPVRMMAVSLLASSPASKFGPVLDSTATRDPSKFVRDMAIALSEIGRETSTNSCPCFFRTSIATSSASTV